MVRWISGVDGRRLEDAETRVTRLTVGILLFGVLVRFCCPVLLRSRVFPFTHVAKVATVECA